MASNTKKSIIVFYHGNCTDGFGGAYAAWKKFGSKADYVPLEYGKPVPISPKGKEIYFIDVMVLEAELTKLIKDNRRVTAIDHHLTKEALVRRTEKYLYALNHSGATLAWQYFHKNKKTPRLLLHIEDGDLWKLTMPYTREIYTILEMKKFDFKVWDKLVRDFEGQLGREKIIEHGKLILGYKNMMIERIIERNAQLVNFYGVRTYAVNSPIYESEIASLLYKKLPPMAIVWSERNGKRKVSLRSIPKFDVSKLAQKTPGGGGHKNSAAFQMDLKSPLPWKRL